MSMYNSLADEAKIEQAIKFVAINQPLPPELEKFLKANGLYEWIVNPGDINAATKSNVA